MQLECKAAGTRKKCPVSLPMRLRMSGTAKIYTRRQNLNRMKNQRSPIQKKSESVFTYPRKTVAKHKVHDFALKMYTFSRSSYPLFSSFDDFL